MATAAVPLSVASAVSVAGLEVHEVSKRYGARWALVRVSFRLTRGEIGMLAGDLLPRLPRALKALGDKR